MIKHVLTVFDEKAQAFLQPFFMDTIGMAERAIRDCLDDPEHNFSKHTSDFTLFTIGLFDNTTGQFTELEKTPLGNLVEYKQNPQKGTLHSITGDKEL